jgi:hypothetical protein
VADGDDVLDAARPAQQQVAMLLHRIPFGDQQPHGFRPFLGEYLQIGDGGFEGVAIGVDRAVDDLVLENQIAHDEIGIQFDGPFASRYARENEDAVRPQQFHQLERHAGRAGRLVYQIDVADQRRQLLQRRVLARDICGADGLDQTGFGTGLWFL